jgi:iron(III) transport system permease protein
MNSLFSRKIDLLSWAVVALMAAPIFGVVLATWWRFDGESWQYVQSVYVPKYFGTTFVFVLFTVVLATVLGFFAAYVIENYEFKGRNFWKWATYIPLAMPGYLAAYAYADVLQVTGPAAGWLMKNFGIELSTYMAWNVRSLGFGVFIMGVTLSPYVFVSVKGGLRLISFSLSDSARVLGMGRVRRFLSVSLPLIGPSVLAGSFLVAWETLSDYGVSEHLAIDTMTIGLFRVWLGMDQLGTASLIAGGFLVLSLALMALQYKFVDSKLFASSSLPSVKRKTVSKPVGLLFNIGCSISPVFGFTIPVCIFVYYSVSNSTSFDWLDFASVGRSFYLALLVVGVTVVLSAFFQLRLDPFGGFKVGSWLTKMSAIGYTIPGVILGIGCLYSFGALHGTPLILVVALASRFFAIPSGNLHASKLHVASSQLLSAKLLGASQFRVGTRILAPQLKKAMLGSSILVFLDVVKELPIVLLLRPFDFELISIRIFHLASDERLPEAANLGLVLVGVAFAGTMLLVNKMEKTS